MKRLLLCHVNDITHKSGLLAYNKYKCGDVCDLVTDVVHNESAAVYSLLKCCELIKLLELHHPLPLTVMWCICV